MNRRDLLLLRVRSGTRVVDLPCERLYMRYLDTQRPGRADVCAREDYFLGEPEPDYQLPTAQELFDGLTEDLRDADVLRVVDAQWLADPQFRRAVEELLARFEAQGGKVEILPAGGGDAASGSAS